MAGFAKIVVAALLVAIVFITFTNFVFFFPWYMTLIYETFNLSQAAAYIITSNNIIMTAPWTV